MSCIPNRRLPRLMASPLSWCERNLQDAGIIWRSCPGVRPGRPRGPAGAAAADRREVAAIFAGGAVGTLARAALAQAFPHPATAWPWPTFGVNIAALGILIGTHL
jgi:hypothetical protein